MKLIYAALLLFSTAAFAKTHPAIEKAILASVQVTVKKQGQGSGFAFYRDEKRGRTLIASNDHVCQLTRGRIYLINEVNYDVRLNTFPMQVEQANGETYQARVAYTSNGHRASKKDRRDDLCIIEIKEEIPLVELGEEAELGEFVFSVSGPRGYFPLVHRGYAASKYLYENSNPIQAFSLYVTSGSSGGGIFDTKGNVVGVIFAIVPTVENLPIPLLTYGVPVQHLKKFKKRYDKRRKKK